MGSENEWTYFCDGKAKVKLPIDLPDDILKDALEYSLKELGPCCNLETTGE